MSLIIDSPQASDASSAPAGRAPGPPPSRRGTWVRVGVAVALVAASAGYRAWQQTKVDEVLRSGRVSPFPLAEIPLELGPWTGKDDTLDPQIARATGAVDSIFRTYTNAETGVRVSLILLYGPAASVFIHAPEVCYPASGYGAVSGPERRPVEVGDESIPFYTHTFARGEGGQRETQRVYCTWRHEGRWDPATMKYKQFERIPGMFKLHLAALGRPRRAVRGL